MAGVFFCFFLSFSILIFCFSHRNNSSTTKFHGNVVIYLPYSQHHSSINQVWFWGLWDGKISTAHKWCVCLLSLSLFPQNKSVWHGTAHRYQPHLLLYCLLLTAYGIFFSPFPIARSLTCLPIVWPAHLPLRETLFNFRNSSYLYNFYANKMTENSFYLPIDDDDDVENNVSDKIRAQLYDTVCIVFRFMCTYG